jgi:hypothetical protein
MKKIFLILCFAIAFKSIDANICSYQIKLFIQVYDGNICLKNKKIIISNGVDSYETSTSAFGEIYLPIRGYCGSCANIISKDEHIKIQNKKSLAIVALASPAALRTLSNYSNILSAKINFKNKSIKYRPQKDAVITVPPILDTLPKFY